MKGGQHPIAEPSEESTCVHKHCKLEVVTMVLDIP